MQRKLGNDFETELAEKLSSYGYWVHNFALGRYGQPVDLIAIKDNMAHLIEAKVCSKGTFNKVRIEDNQILAIMKYHTSGNGSAWFAFKFDENIYMVEATTLLQEKQKVLNEKKIAELGMRLENWK